MHLQDFVDEFVALDQRQGAQLEFIGVGNVGIAGDVDRAGVDDIAGERRLVSCIEIGPEFLLEVLFAKDHLLAVGGRRKSRRWSTLLRGWCFVFNAADLKDVVVRVSSELSLFEGRDEQGERVEMHG